MATSALDNSDTHHGEAGLMSDAHVVARILDHIDNETTDKGNRSWKEPTENYQSTERLEAELALIRRRWVVFCPSEAITEAGDYIARDAAKVPLVVVRGNDGTARAFRNACRHRGVQVASGEGCAKVFVCPYHGWSYGTDGALRTIPHKDGFPDVNKDDRGLVAVECQEKNGLIFVRQEAGSTDDADQTELPDLIPEGFRVIRSEALEIEANWKLHLESSLEGYHIRKTHQKTFFPVQYDNLTVVETFGQNNRIAFPYQSIEALRDRPQSSWSANGRLTYVYHLFPNIVISTFPDCMQVVVLEPLGVSRTRQHMFLLSDCGEQGQAFDAVIAGQELAKEGAVEDREVVLGAQRGLAAQANENLEFGLFESAICHFHETLTQELDGNSS